jgi:hypothetical protein
VKRFTLTGLAFLTALACAACGGGGTHAAARSHALPPTLVKQIQAAVRKPSPISGVLSTKTVEVYGPASHRVLEKASSGSSESLRYSGDWYLIVRRGHFAGNLPVPPGAKEPRARIAMEVWSPKATAGRAFSFANRIPAAVTRLSGHAVIDLS